MLRCCKRFDSTSRPPARFRLGSSWLGIADHINRMAGWRTGIPVVIGLWMGVCVRGEFSPEFGQLRQEGHYEVIQMVAATASFGMGTRGFGGRERHNMAGGQLQAGRTITGMMGDDEWWQGRWMFLGEISVAHRYQPDGAVIASLTPMIRYQFLPRGRFAPFIEGGVGVTWTDIGEPDLSTRFQFNSQGGSGVHLFVREEVAITAVYRLTHYSNGGMRRPNSGVNVNSVLFGVTCFF